MAEMFVMQPGGDLVEVTATQYVDEPELQRYIANYPNLLAGDQIDPQNPRRWLLINREVGIPASADTGDRWSLDHLFIDHEGMPTLVEVKRSSDTRIRREVVGQMMDYASNALAYLPATRMRALFEERCMTEGLNADDELQQIIQGDDVEGFWATVQTNLAESRIRLLFVADVIPSELQRIIEFLNAHMNPVEVLGIEVRQFVGEGLKTFVPRVVGQLESLRVAKNRSQPKREWDEASFFAALKDRTPNSVEVARVLLKWAADRGLRMGWGSGAQTGYCWPIFDGNGDWHVIFAMLTNGRVELQFGQQAKRSPFDDEARRLDLMRRFNAVPGVKITQDRLRGYPAVMMSDISSSVDQFLKVCDYWLEERRAAAHA
jgi:hypothetical protein